MLSLNKRFGVRTLPTLKSNQCFELMIKSNRDRANVIHRISIPTRENDNNNTDAKFLSYTNTRSFLLMLYIEENYIFLLVSV